MLEDKSLETSSIRFRICYTIRAIDPADDVAEGCLQFMGYPVMLQTFYLALLRQLRLEIMCTIDYEIWTADVLS